MRKMSVIDKAEEPKKSDKDNNPPTSDKIYTFDEALNETGSGSYNTWVVAVMTLVAFAMACDMFGFSMVISGATCEFHLDIRQTSLLLSMSFIGPIVLSYTWGYVADTQGRRKCLLICLWGSCIVSSISAFSPNWIVLAILKFFSTSFISCVQSLIFTSIGESCPQRVRDSYMIVVAGLFQCVMAFYIGIAYIILNLKFSHNMGFISFTPWRLLVLVLASISGLAAIGGHHLYESPKFLLNIGQEEKALDVLNKIYKRNGGVPGSYPVKRVYLNEDGNPDKDTTVPFFRSLWKQLVPIFQPPLLWRSMQVYFLAFVVYGTSNSYYVWFPYLAQKFVEGMGSKEDQGSGLCKMIVSKSSNSTTTAECSTKVEISLFISTLAMGLVFATILCCLARISYRKRAIMMTILLLSGICGIAAVFIPNSIISLILFFGTMMNGLIVCMIFSFVVDLYPTTYRGMAACLCTMVARTGTLSGINLIGAFVMSNCRATFSFCSLLLIAGVFVTSLLPRDKPRAINP